MPAPWPTEQADEAAKLWKEGLSAREIAQRFPGRTRNAVLGMLGRRGLLGGAVRTTQPRSKPVVARARPAPLRLIAPASIKPMAHRADPTAALRFDAPAPAPPPVSPATARAKPLLERQFGECAWPVDGGTQQLFCCAPVAAGRSYCAHHLAKGWQVLVKSEVRGLQRLSGRYSDSRVARDYDDQDALGLDGRAA